jgi:hypothetical protein
MKRVLSGMVADTLALVRVEDAEDVFNRGSDYSCGNGVPIFLLTPRQRIRWLPCARIQNSIICRRSSRQCIARLIRLRSTLHPPPGSGSFAFRISRTRGISRQFIYLELKAHFLNY